MAEPLPSKRSEQLRAVNYGSIAASSFDETHNHNKTRYEDSKSQQAPSHTASLHGVL